MKRIIVLIICISFCLGINSAMACTRTVNIGPSGEVQCNIFVCAAVARQKYNQDFVSANYVFLPKSGVFQSSNIDIEPGYNLVCVMWAPGVQPTYRGSWPNDSLQDYINLLVDIENTAINHSKYGNIPQYGNTAMPAESGYAVEKLNKNGTIAGDEVILRSAPSPSGNVLGTLYKGQEIKITGKYVCEDKNTAILKRSGNIRYENQTYNLKEGQLLKIRTGGPNGYICELNLDGKEIVTRFPEDALRILYGEVWYRVEIPGKNMSGYVFGQYVQI